MPFCIAQKANFRYYSVDEGLPQATVYEMLLDNKGYLWFGTQGGLSRFDGKNFEVYNQETGLAGNHVLELKSLRIDSTRCGLLRDNVEYLNFKSEENA